MDNDFSSQQTPAAPRETQTVLEPGDLLDKRGRLIQAGWSTKSVKSYVRKAIKAPGFRIKEWDYYLVNDDDFAVAVTLGDMSYAGLLSISVMDFKRNEFLTRSEMTALPFGKFHMPEHPNVGISSFSTKKSNFHFEVKDDGTRELNVHFDNFWEGKPIDFHVELTDIPEDSMVIATPWKENKHAFYYNQKMIGMAAYGSFTIGDFTHNFYPLKSGSSKEAGPAFGLLDWGRGVWTYDNYWYWGAAQGEQDGHVIGFNLGYGFGDTSAASENMFFLDGHAHKLGRVDFGVPMKGDGFQKNVEKTYDLLKPWHITDDEGRLDLVFTPDFDRFDYIDLKVIISDQHQVYGKLNGFVVLDNGEKFEIENLRGSAEVVHNKY